MQGKINKKALKVLRLEERSALSLQIQHNKSSWEAGEILDKSHYKYLEIKYRAEHFLKIFSNHYNLYSDNLFPISVVVEEDVKEFFIQTIEKRKTIRDAVLEIQNPLYRHGKERDPIIIQFLKTLQTTKSVHYQNTYQLIMEFDRYNNTRILPKEVQELSAFKRRNTKRYKKQLKICTSLSPYATMRIKQLFVNNSRAIKEDNAGYIVLICDLSLGKSDIVRVKVDQIALDRISQISTYIFKTSEDAQEFMELVIDYMISDDKGPKLGLVFWPNFRLLVNKAVNYDQVNNITPTRKNLELAMRDMDHKNIQRGKMQNYFNSFT